MNIPPLDLKAQYQSIREEINQQDFIVSSIIKFYGGQTNLCKNFFKNRYRLVKEVKKKLSAKERVLILLNYVTYQGQLIIEKDKLKKVIK